MNRFGGLVFDGLTAISTLLFMALVADRIFIHKRLAAVPPPPPPTMTTTEVNGVWEFNYHDSVVSSVSPCVQILGWRIPVYMGFILTIACPLCWIITRSHFKK